MEILDVLAVDDNEKLAELKFVLYDYLNTAEKSRKRIMRETNRILKKLNNNENMNDFMKDFYHSRLQMLARDLEDLNKSLAEVNSALKG